MLTRNCFWLGVALALFSVATTANANLISGGSFEPGSFVPQSQEMVEMIGQSTGTPVWDIAGGEIEIVWIGEGKFWAYLKPAEGGNSRGVAPELAGGFERILQSMVAQNKRFYGQTTDLGNSIVNSYPP